VRAEQRGEQVEIAVSDTGPGIPAAQLPKVFDRFSRGTVSRAGSGSGLGLAIAKALVEAQGGEIRVESEAGQGSRFVVRLAADLAGGRQSPGRSGL
jgi:signal transduction histidine kinase